MPFVAGMAMLVLATGAAPAAHGAAAHGSAMGTSAEAILVAEVLLLMLVGRGLGEIMQRFGQPAVIGQLLAGLILGPSLFGWAWPEAHDLIFPKTPEQKSLITGLANMGVMMLLLLTGMETDLKLVRKVGLPAIAITATGVAVPFICGFALGQFLPDSILPAAQHRLIASLFLGTALSISSIKIVAMVVREMNFTRRNLGQIIVGSAIMEDTTGWIIISITLGIAGAGGFALGSLAKTVIGTAIFLALSYTIGRKLVFWLIRWVNDTFVSEYAVVTAILIVMCLMALITQLIGVNTVLGAFVAGVLIGESPILSKHIEDQLRGFITAFMMPVFFGLSGLSADLTILKDPHLAILTAGLVAIASVGKFAGAFTGGRLSGLASSESLAVGCAMNARGSTEVIVATIGLSMGALTQNLYTMIVTMAVLTTMAMPPMLRWALRRLPISAEEKARLEKEELDAKGFVSKFERLLIAADESPNGKFASRVAGFIAGRRGIPITVLPIDQKRKKEETTELTVAATEAAKEGHQATKARDDEAKPERVEVSARPKEPVKEAVRKEAPKGYDILFVGIDDAHDKDGFAAAIDRVTVNFEGPVALTLVGKDTDLVTRTGYNILVPVNGTDASRRGAELAFASASARDSKISMLHVANPNGHSSKGRRAERRRKKAERDLIDDVRALAARYGHDRIQTSIHTDTEAPHAILEEAKRSNCDLIVLGTRRRVGDHLTVGQTASVILEQWKGGLVVVVT
ncbi:MAG: cation:proton antiporter [Alphaproteobacteria bacterium]|nr:cation:proton antiporter [Alphaproteobacteria bacterium]